MLYGRAETRLGSLSEDRTPDTLRAYGCRRPPDDFSRAGWNGTSKKDTAFMALRISGKHMDIGDSLRERIEDRIGDAVEKYFGNGYSGHVTVEKDGAFFEADCLVHLNSGMVLQASGRENDATAAFERAAERIEKRLRRYKRRLRNHHKSGPNGEEQASVAYAVVESPNEEDEMPEDFAPVIVAESARTVRTQSVAMAVMQLDLMDAPVNVFRNAGSGAINVVYRRPDGNIGWVDPGSPVQDERTD